jgi:uncharacterized protein YecE (DUF72 family)
MGKGEKILVGTSGYSYPEWVGPVYPQGSRPEDFLGLYGARFPTVELNFSFYAMPRAERLGKMLAGGGPSLTFSVKAHESLTHRVDGGKWREEAAAFIRALEPLRQPAPGFAGGRLEAVLFQFPYSFHYEPDQRRYLDRLLGEFAGLPAAVEFRNARWFNPRTFDGLRRRGVTLVSLDMPDLRGLPPALDEPTAPLAYLRFHGRNGAAWWEGGDRAARYHYRYPEAELRAAAERVRRIAPHVRRVLVYFNNHPLGYAALNAGALMGMLETSAAP